ncbi:hypothetical protein IJH27_00200 [Candidatus Saccharibacteria bacterium]|nr:hypothetical protein [Candidatus Saccharibacteria bacterium]
MKRKFYAVSENANYSHLWMYLFYFAFEKAVYESDFPYRCDYDFRVSIDKNVVKNVLESRDKTLFETLEGLVSSKMNFSKKEVEVALNRLSLKLAQKFKIKDFEKLKTEINNVEISEVRPSKYNDDVTSDGFDLFGDRKVRMEIVELGRRWRDFGLPAARIINIKHEDLLAISERERMVIFSDEGTPVDYEKIFDEIIEKLKK